MHFPRLIHNIVLLSYRYIKWVSRATEGLELGTLLLLGDNDGLLDGAKDSIAEGATEGLALGTLVYLMSTMKFS